MSRPGRNLEISLPVAVSSSTVPASNSRRPSSPEPCRYTASAWSKPNSPASVRNAPATTCSNTNRFRSFTAASLSFVRAVARHGDLSADRLVTDVAGAVLLHREVAAYPAGVDVPRAVRVHDDIATHVS